MGWVLVNESFNQGEIFEERLADIESLLRRLPGEVIGIRDIGYELQTLVDKVHQRPVQLTEESSIIG